MEKQYKDLCVALERFKIALHHYAKAQQKVSPEDKQIRDMMRDSVFCRFKYCYELSWKYLFLYMQEKETITVQVFSPRSVFRDACKAALITEQEATCALEMAEARNKTSHIYKEEIADQLATLIENYYKLMFNWANRIKP